ncbi:hypothetical protein V495_06656 [Pseudogymnoascus sp. VKM F-4514 (FW-929)]|nr:hypothetical protein V495_06656 [Pseudogymnoascus sp. VKM F-4514 (FW-929)]KFY56859.1 hypothetical protein V497_05935 [Pseudogymnoascus sp. VKM F-4516 (FW-969)]
MLKLGRSCGSVNDFAEPLNPDTMSTPRFFSQPLKYLHWAAIQKPAIFYSIIVGSMGPVLVLTAPAIRHRLGDGPRPPIPSTYPVPTGPRKQLSGYDD